MARKNIFTIHQDYEKKPDRNTFDLSFANNLTTKFGQLTPVFIKECSPGDSFRIKPHAAFQFMPMQFPVQTPMRAYLHFFKTRNRTMWKDWMDFIGGTKKNLVHPYVHPVDKKKFYRVGGLADYLGVPNTLYNVESLGSSSGANPPVDSADVSTVTFPIVGANQSIHQADDDLTINWSSLQITSFVPDEFMPFVNANTYEVFSQGSSSANSMLQTLVSGIKDYAVGNVMRKYSQLDPNRQPNPYSWPYSVIASYSDVKNVPFIPWEYVGTIEKGSDYMVGDISINFTCSSKSIFTASFSDMKLPVIYMTLDSEGKVTNVFGRLVTPVEAGGTSNHNQPQVYRVDLTDIPINSDIAFYILPPCITLTLSDSDKTLTASSKLYASDGITVFRSIVNTDSEGNPVVINGVIGDGSLTVTPYDSAIRLNALPFRAYECVYNAYYRNSVNDPFKPDGVNPEYNKFLPSYEGGEDTYQYDLYFRNWEYDFLTSAIPTPQFGNAPLVGLTNTGAATVEDSNGNRFIVQANIDSDGEITGWTTKKENDPSGSLRMLMSMATTGISINDLRNVNAYQRFLENAIRKGLSYRDQILAHYGVSVRYDELDMPEFIGGASCSIRMNKINQLSEGGDTPLGSFVGQAEAEMHGKHEITEYCDEHGFIIGILSIVPLPVYSQLLPKFFMRSEQLDYYFPEFRHVGYQPIQQKEVSPLQTFYSGGDLNKTFGYNRAFYDLIASTDEVHGQFRTTMRDFIMNRTFENEPSLGGDFLHVDPDQLNDVFIAGDLKNSDGQNIYAPDADKIIGSMYFEVQKKSPISLYGIAKLE